MTMEFIEKYKEKPLARGEGNALWKQISNLLQSEIALGQYAENEGRLPTERELTDRFAVNRHTVRRALATLAEMGLIRTEQGRGVFVNKDLIEYPLGRRVRFTETLSARQRTPVARVLEIVKEAACCCVAEALDLSVGDKVWRVERLGFLDDQPVTISSHHVSYTRFPEFDRPFMQHESITRALAAFGVADYERRETHILARPATAEETRLLQLGRARPVLITEGINVYPDGRPVEFSITRFAADRVQLRA